MKIKKSDLGVLLNHSSLSGALKGRYWFEYLPFYAEAAQKSGVTVVFFSNRSFLAKDDLVRAYSWNPATRTYIPGIFKIPLVIHNRALLSQKEARRIYSLLANNRTILFNGLMRYDKWTVHRRLSTNPFTSKYLPETERLLSREQILAWLKRHKTVYLKPCSGSLGKGVIRLHQTGGRLEISRTAKSRSTRHFVSFGKIAEIRRRIGRRPYLIQEGIPLLKIRNQPIDFRVSVQKGASGEWSVSGVVAKVGTRNAHATNLAVGGKAAPAKKVLATAFEKSKAEAILQEIKGASLLIARQIEEIGPNIADLGLDLTVTKDGAIKFIEANGRDLRITFRNARQKKMWRRTFQNPILYGVRLLQRMKRGTGSPFTAGHKTIAYDIHGNVTHEPPEPEGERREK